MNFNYDLDYIEKKVKDKLSEKRYIHSLNTANLAKKISKSHNFDEDTAYLAGIVHDYAKEFKEAELIELAQKYGLELNDDLMKFRFFLHAYVGAEIIRNEFNIEDSDIINSIRYHTTGRDNMSLLEKIIYVADYLEAGRRHSPESEMEELRDLSLKDINKTVLIVINKTLKYLIDKNRIIHTDSIKAWNYLIIDKGE